MSYIGTFGSFTTARLGIYASQLGLNVTGNNIANINTPGYTRQNLDQVSLRAGAGDLYQSRLDVRMGNGVLSTGVSQIRDPFLDIRYRAEAASVGFSNTKLSGLGDLSSILDEVAKGGDENGVIEAQLSEVLKALQNLSANAGQETYDTQVRSSMETLVTLFNKYAKDLEGVYKNTVESFRQDMEKVNKLLSNIADLNASIRKSEIHGDSALEMKDERNRLIDELSSYVNIDVIYSQEDLGGGFMVEKLTIKLANSNPDPTVTTDSSTLVDGAYATQLGITQIPKPNPDYDANKPGSLPFLDGAGQPTGDADKAAKIDDPNFRITLDELKDAHGQLHPDPALQGKVHLDDNDLYGSLQATRELLTESGEFTTADTIAQVDENAATKRGIPYYQKALDLLANKFATVFNEANQGYMVNENNEYIDDKGAVINDPATGKPIKKEYPLTEATENILKAAGATKKGGNLFSNRGDGNDATGITAGNISISHAWSLGDIRIVASFKKPTDQDVGSTDNSNILHMISLMTEKMAYNPKDVAGDAYSDRFFEGSFQEMLTHVSGVLGKDANSTNIKLNTYYGRAIELDTSRSSIAGVDLNDEASNLMRYQKSYSAACRLMTTLDQVLDKLINGTGVAGL